MSRNPIGKRKSPYYHTVSAHTRSGVPVRSFTRGTGEPIPTSPPGRRRRVVGATKVVQHDLLMGTTTIRPMKPRKPGQGPSWKEPYTGIGPPKRAPEFPPIALPMPSEPPLPVGPIPTPMPILVPEPIPTPPGIIRRGHGGWVKYDVKTGGVTTYIPGTRGQPGIVTYTPDPDIRVPYDPSIKYEPILMPTPVPIPEGRGRRRRFTPKDIIRKSNQLLVMYKRTRPIQEKIDIFNQLRALSDEHMRLTGNPTVVHHIQPTDLFTKEQLEEYSRRVRRKK